MLLNTSVFIRFASVFLALVVSSGAVDALADTREAYVTELRKIGDELKRAILSRDIKGILKYVNKEGIFCIDNRIAFDRVEKDLKAPDSQLYTNLFGRGGMKEYFESAKDQTIRINFSVVNGKENIRSTCLRYTSSNYADWPEVCFYFEDGKWGINDSLYNCL